MRIHKYDLTYNQPGEDFELEFPAGPFQALELKSLPGPGLMQIVLWVRVNAGTNKKQKVPFVFLGTGWDIPDDCKYVGTVVVGEFVWHLHRRKAHVTDRPLRQMEG